ncbi:hypothetical protein [Herbaspirillum rubrisubalbicans]|uniref:hypothetical protein n=1 Tax=Herbaspirillum rubrisubalbicans TaxID=80842 RepID=UPI000A77B2E1|nr:hypothetical protein [Herbaspirillum rubrisubalbicans]
MSAGPKDFSKAIRVAEKSAHELLPGLSDLQLEGVVVSGKDFEVTFSYYFGGQSPIELSHRAKKDGSLGLMAAMLTTRRTYKVFLVDKNTFNFRGFKAYKE